MPFEIDVDRFTVSPGSAIELSDTPTTPPDGAPSIKEGRKATEKLRKRLINEQRKLFADQTHRVLVILQAIDTGGKDGTIKNVFRGVNPSGVRVASFRQPNVTERAHDYLWRVHPEVPGDGDLVVFNRSHYEDVLVVRVHELVEREVWRKRYRHIRDFERMLADEGTTIVKFFLHISKDEQARRLQSRIDNPEKNWKFSTADLDERKLWDDYQEAFADMITETSTGWAPWHVIPADEKWYRDLVVMKTLVDTLERLDLHYPENKDDLSDVIIS